jgi:hypothetical protein
MDGEVRSGAIPNFATRASHRRVKDVSAVDFLPLGYRP